MADSKAFQQAQYPLVAYNYRVTLDGQTASFSEVTGLAVSYETTTYRHGLSFVEGETIDRIPNLKYTPLTMKRGIFRGIKVLSDWLASGESRAIGVSLCDETSLPVVTWHIAKAVPVKLEGPTLSANGSEAAVESLELIVSGISLEHH